MNDASKGTERAVWGEKSRGQRPTTCPACLSPRHVDYLCATPDCTDPLPRCDRCDEPTSPFCEYCAAGEEYSLTEAVVDQVRAARAGAKTRALAAKDAARVFDRTGCELLVLKAQCTWRVPAKVAADARQLAQQLLDVADRLSPAPEDVIDVEAEEEAAQ